MSPGVRTVGDDYERDEYIAEPIARPITEKNKDNGRGMRPRRRLWQRRTETGEYTWAVEPCIGTKLN